MSDAQTHPTPPINPHRDGFIAGFVSREKELQQQIARLEADNRELFAKLKSTERALDAYACQLANEALLGEHDAPAQKEKDRE